jgi:hypothetical protein
VYLGVENYFEGTPGSHCNLVSARKFQKFEDGIPLPDETWGNIVSLANGLGIEVEE